MENQHTEWFKITTGVRQGDVLSPILFNLVVDWIMKKIDANVHGGVTWTNNTTIRDVEYADDVCLVSQTMEHMSAMTDSLHDEAKKIGLEINRNKSKAMKARIDDNAHIIVDGEELEEVDHFTYLGSELTVDGDIRREVNIRIGKAGAAFKKLNKVWSNSGLSVSLKIKLFGALVLSVLTYGSETWKELKLTRE